jgi:hypothetical protein
VSRDKANYSFASMMKNLTERCGEQEVWFERSEEMNRVPVGVGRNYKKCHGMNGKNDIASKP